ncbi:MAG: tetratricopeptide repeat protein [Candidatus Rokubacteria bacterium]|nr:tetratricopeptide repeat protein [Candidatus Rokubacteria bacterium]
MIPGALRPVSLALGLFLLACNATQPGPQPSTQATDATSALEALQAGDYQRASELYRRALAAEPGSVGLHYGLAVAVSYLKLRDQAAREFRWVLEQAPPASEAAGVARNWLANAGLLPRPTAPPPAVTEQLGGEEASLEGHAAFSEDGKAPGPMRRLQLFLVGQQGTPTKDEYRRIRTDEDGGFRFLKVPVGSYKLTNRIAGRPIWRLRVELKPGESKQLELTPANSTATRDDFPETR